MPEVVKYVIGNGGELKIDADGFKSGKCKNVLEDLRKHLAANGIKSDQVAQDLKAEAMAPFIEEKGQEVFARR